MSIIVDYCLLLPNVPLDRRQRKIQSLFDASMTQTLWASGVLQLPAAVHCLVQGQYQLLYSTILWNLTSARQSGANPEACML